MEKLIELYPGIENCTIQTFDDDPKRKDQWLARIFSMKQADPAFLNDWNEKWAGIFFSVNGMQEGKRNKDSVTTINSWICEVDWLSKDLQRSMIMNCPLYPSMIIESKSSLHLYRFAENWTKENWNRICNWLRNYFDWDPAVVDISRVLRVPGYNHCKDRNDKFMIEIVWWVGSSYNEDQMSKAFPDQRSVTEIKQSMIQKESNASKDLWWDYFRERVKAMDSKSMLNEISWHEFVNWDQISFQKNNNWTEQIYVNWKSTWCWIDKSWKVGSLSWWWPNRTNRVFRYSQCDGSKLAKRVFEKHPEMKQSKFIKTIEKKEVAKKDIRVEKDRVIFDFDKNKFTRWLDSLDKNFRKPDTLWELIVLFWSPGSWKTEFCFFLARNNGKNAIATSYFALEVPEDAILKRWSLRKLWLSWEDLDFDRLTWEDKIRVQKYLDDFKRDTKDFMKIISITSSPTIEDLLEKMEQERQDWKTFFIIDNLWKIDWNPEENVRFADITSKLQTFAYKNKVQVVLQHHTVKAFRTKNDSVETAFESKIFWPDWFRWSAKIKDNATRMVEINRMYSTNETNLLQYKHSPTWTTWLEKIYFDKWEYTSDPSF